jgi:L-histidine Nalpha-methyltransferase
MEPRRGLTSPAAGGSPSQGQREVDVLDPFLRIERLTDAEPASVMAEDVRRGLTRRQKTLPAKYFYDDRGAKLFDAICDLPEYYLTRSEEALLQRVAPEIVAAAAPTHLIELGSGASRKTRLLLDALLRTTAAPCYTPLDVSEGMLRDSAATLRQRYPRLRVHGLVADYERHLDHFPPAGRRLVAFLGSTIGNYTRADSVAFLRGLCARMDARDHLLLGLDLAKPTPILEAAYNDSAGITAEFNRNILRVVNRELEADFDPLRFDHVAFFSQTDSQIEMHLRAQRAHVVRVAALGLTVPFSAGETIHTEISRKFSRSEAEHLLLESGFRMRRWYVSADGYFALALAQVPEQDRTPEVERRSA